MNVLPSLIDKKIFDHSNSVFKLWKEFDDFLNGHNVNQHPVVMLNFETP